ncbi:MAG: SDR family NAD(P)-dependent oxidoreductase [Spirochaetaceae bacterium]
MTKSRVAVVAGGTGGIGEGIVSAMLSADYRVYVPTRSADRSDRLRSHLSHPDSLFTVPADLGDEHAVAALRDTVLGAEQHIDAVVVSVGADYYGYRMHRMPRKDWNKSIEDNLVTHFNIQRTFVDQLRKQNHGSYITLIGPEAENIRPEAGMLSIMATAQKMMARVIAQEASDSDVRVHILTARTTVRTRSRGAEANTEWITAQEIGEYIVRLLEGSLPTAGETLHELRNRDHVREMLKRAVRR